jgi:16S rRNA (cytosine967-C5)-methyltransferase
VKKVPGVDARRQAMLLMAGSSVDLGLTGPDRAFAHRIYRETVIWRARLDYTLSALSQRPLDSLERELLTCLRIGAVQLLILRVPAHAAVSSTVSVLRGQKKKAYANAVLRRLSVTGEREGAPLCIRYSHPQDLVEKWIGYFGMERACRLLEWNNSVPGLGVWLRDGASGCKCPVHEPVKGEIGQWLPSYRKIEREALQDVVESEGCFVQDQAAAVTGVGMSSLPGLNVLEIGCAPGGKTVHLDEPSDFVTALDSSELRMKTWIENSIRYRWTSSFPVVAAGELLPFRRSSFDKVLVDAPCTNTGVYRRRFDARWNWSPGLLSACTGTQSRLLNSAAAALRPGGVLVYSTCSLEPEENSDQVIRFERDHPEFCRITFPAQSQLVTDGMLSIFPPEHDMDGMFAASWKKSE